jgi:lipid-A-disaccharide synthase
MINKKRLEQFEAQWKSLSPQLPLRLILGKTHEVIKNSDIVAVASGTATLETMLLKRPMVVLYKGSFISYWIVRFLIKIRQFSLPNILANEILVPEFIQENATPENIANSIEEYFLHPEKIEYLNKRFTEIHQTLKCDAAKKAAQAIEQLINV